MTLTRSPLRSAGFVLHEAMMALALSLALMAGIAELLNMAAQERRAAGQYAAAVAEAGNLMEELVSRPWEETSGEKLAAIGLSPATRRRLPDAKLALEIADEQHGVRRIRVVIDWQAASGSRHRPVALVGWKFRPEETRP